jgi:hypothetical protein
MFAPLLFAIGLMSAPSGRSLEGIRNEPCHYRCCKTNAYQNV